MLISDLLASVLVSASLRVCVCVCVYMPSHFGVYLLATVCVGQEVGGVSKCVCVHAHANRAPPKVFYVSHARVNGETQR